MLIFVSDVLSKEIDSDRGLSRCFRTFDRSLNL